MTMETIVFTTKFFFKKCLKQFAVHVLDLHSTRFEVLN